VWIYLIPDIFGGLMLAIGIFYIYNFCCQPGAKMISEDGDAATA